MRMRTTTVVSAFLFLSAIASTAVAQSTRWASIPGGDTSGEYLSVERGAPEGTLSGTRTIASLTRTTGYTTGSTTTIVLSGSEPESARTIRVHLPYGAALDLAQGDRVEVELASRLMGLGSVHDVRIVRDGTLVLLQTSARTPPHGITIARGTEAPRTGSRRSFGLEVHIDGHAASIAPSQLAWIASASLVCGGSDVIYDGPRPPDAFDQRILVAARVQRMAPAPTGPAVSS
jgi:hypothetical protein